MSVNDISACKMKLNSNSFYNIPRLHFYIMKGKYKIWNEKKSVELQLGLCEIEQII
jgi:hypothetical protein